MKILNLYAGIGGNRKLWEGCEVTAVEYNMQIAQVYTDLYPDDEIVIGDAHEYLLKHFDEFDFIWASPPCQTHSSMRQNIAVRFRGTKPEYPDMKLYQEIIFLQHNFKGKWVVENVKPYYDPLIKPNFELQRHFFWSNFDVEEVMFKKSNLRSSQIDELQDYLGIDISNYKVSNKRQVLRNCLLPDVGLHIIEHARVSKETGSAK